MKTLTPIWFDIDGTLLHTRAGHDAFRDAWKDVYGWEVSMESVVFAGNTDLRVMMQLSQEQGTDRDSVLEEPHVFFRRMAEVLDEGLTRNPPSVVPGAPELVHRLVDMPDLLLGLLTGNARDCAFIKLRHVELHTAFEDGGFGDEHADRNVLAQTARKRMQASLPSDTQLAPGWVIGDTPRDVQAAKQIGAHCLGVASGAYTAEDLRAEGADEVVTDLQDTERILMLLMG